MDLLDAMDDDIATTIGSTSISRTEPKNAPKKNHTATTYKMNSASVTPKKRPRNTSSANETAQADPLSDCPDGNPRATDFVNDLSSDSPLSDPPSDLDLDSDLDSPFFSNPTTPVKPTKVQAIKVKRPTRSPYFPKPPPPKRITCLPFPPLSASRFGLMQERLAYDPFRMLIATIFLNRTRGEQAMPVYAQLIERYPTTEALADANTEDIMHMIHKLGFQNQRAKKCVELAKAWLSTPPVKWKRYRKINYPLKTDGRNIKAEEVLDDDDDRVAWEIANLPGLGAYALDSWRIFCRDKLRGLSDSFDVDGDETFEPEWKRVVPTDKELRAYLTWRWLKLGYIWNKETGQKTKADEKTLERAKIGGVVHDEGEYLVLTSEPADGAEGELAKTGAQAVKANVERTAGSFMRSESKDEIAATEGSALDIIGSTSVTEIVGNYDTGAQDRKGKLSIGNVQTPRE